MEQGDQGWFQKLNRYLWTKNEDLKIKKEGKIEQIEGLKFEQKSGKSFFTFPLGDFRSNLQLST